MRPWETFSARDADDFDYDGLADALKPDWDLLDRHNWRRDFEEQHGDDLDDDALDRHADLASAVLGMHPATQVTTPPSRQLISSGENEPGGDDRPQAEAPDSSLPREFEIRPPVESQPENYVGLPEPTQRPASGRRDSNLFLDALLAAEESRRNRSPKLDATLATLPGKTSPSTEIQAGSVEANRMAHPVPSQGGATEFFRSARDSLGRAVDWSIARVNQPGGFENLDPEVRKVLEEARASMGDDLDAVLDNWPGGKGLKSARAAIR